MGVAYKLMNAFTTCSWVAAVSRKLVAIQTKLSAIEPVCSFGFVVLYFRALCRWHMVSRVSVRCHASSPELLNSC